MDRLFRKICKTIKCKPEEAEMIKIMSNAFRYINFSFQMNFIEYAMKIIWTSRKLEEWCEWIIQEQVVWHPEHLVVMFDERHHAIELLR